MAPSFTHPRHPKPTDGEKRVEHKEEDRSENTRALATVGGSTSKDCHRTLYVV